MIRSFLSKLRFKARLHKLAKAHRAEVAAGDCPDWPAYTRDNCRMLRTKAEFELATQDLESRGFVYHPAVLAKNWDLIYVLANIGSGPVLDMGCVESGILENLIIAGNDCELHGIDLRVPYRPVPGVVYTQGDLMRCPYADQMFSNICCLSVIEHGVDYGMFLDESVRLLKPNGKLFISFDYWPDWNILDRQLFGLPWIPLNEERLNELVEEAGKRGLVLDSPLNAAVEEAVIDGSNWAPFEDVAYTFGLLVLRLKPSAK